MSTTQVHYRSLCTLLYPNLPKPSHYKLIYPYKFRIIDRHTDSTLIGAHLHSNLPILLEHETLHLIVPKFTQTIRLQTYLPIQIQNH